MPDLLLELFSEEIPARMQARAAEELKAKVTGALVDAGVTYEGAIAHVTPRRLTLHIAGALGHSPSISEEKRGPKVGAPEVAIQGFLKGAGLSSIKEARIEGDEKKGQHYIATIKKEGRATSAILADILPKIIAEFSWPKSMRWGAASTSSSSLRWVRPLHSILCTFGSETETADVIDFEIGGIKSGDTTYGHRFLSSGKIQARHFEDYAHKLEKAHVVLDAARRRDIILHDAKQLAFAQGLELIEDPALLDEVAGLVEWPVVLMGSFDAAFLDLPEPVIRTTIRNNQKCFVLRDKAGKLANKFILTANITANDGGKEIIAGNERVVRARLSDAKFFFEQDKKIKLLDRLPKLDSITFHEKLGTQGDRVRRLAHHASKIAPFVGAKAEDAELAAELAKADLVTGMVGEFPELQGFMGRTYAKLEGVPEDIAAAVEDHYKPQGPSDVVPSNPVSIAVALADKIDTLVGFWLIDEKPTGSKDPYALRRAALGLLRLILENNLRLRLQIALMTSSFLYQSDLTSGEVIDITTPELNYEAAERLLVPKNRNLLAFLGTRLKVQLRDQGISQGAIDIVLGTKELDDLDDILPGVNLVKAFDTVMKTETGQGQLAEMLRVASIVEIEQEKDKRKYEGIVDTKKLKTEEEKELHRAADESGEAIEIAIKKGDFLTAVKTIADMAFPISNFFENVMVNEEPYRENRLQLLVKTRGLLKQLRIRESKDK